MTPSLEQIAGGPGPVPNFHEHLPYLVCPYRMASNEPDAVQTTCPCGDEIEHHRLAPVRPIKICGRCGEIERLKAGRRRQ